MGRRGQKGVAIMALPRITQSSGGASIATAGQTDSTGWALYKHDDGDDIKARLGLADAKRPDSYELRNAIGGTGWMLKIKRPRLHGRAGAGFIASIAYTPDGTNWTEYTRLYGGHQRGWTDAIREVNLYVNLYAAMVAVAPKIKQDGMTEFRPFVVRYPWSESDEPNRHYSPFKLCPAFAYDLDSDGVAMVVPKAYLNNKARLAELSRALDCNAYLAHNEADGGAWRVYHRNGMSEFDLIDIDDFRTRLIAGTADGEDE